jgi:hypothetical protein
MSIAKTKEQIAKAAKGEYLGTLVWLDRAIGDEEQTELGTIGDHKALADSHTALLEAAKGVWAFRDSVESPMSDDQLYPAMDVLGAAIEQAEGDGGSLTLEQMREHVARQDPNYRDQQQAEGEG